LDSSAGNIELLQVKTGKKVGKKYLSLKENQNIFIFRYLQIENDDFFNQEDFVNS